jgi:integrase
MQKIANFTNDEYLANWLGGFSLGVSQGARYHNMKRFFSFINHRPILSLTFEDYMEYFRALKANPELTDGTKKQYWRQLHSFVIYLSESTGITINFPVKTAKWGHEGGKAGNPTTDTVLSREQVLELREKAKLLNYSRYFMFLLQSDTGMRCTQLVSIELSDLHLDQRVVYTIHKGGGKKDIYPFSELTRDELAKYLRGRIEGESKYLFPGNTGHHASTRIYEDFILELCGRLTRWTERDASGNRHTREKRQLGTYQAASHTFRRTLNTLRKNMGCLNEDREFLLNQKVSMNGELYVKMSVESRVALFDKWNPFV